jgi:hypothetical protein
VRACVRARARARPWVCVCVYLFVCVCVCVRACVRARARVWRVRVCAGVPDTWAVCARRARHFVCVRVRGQERLATNAGDRGPQPTLLGAAVRAAMLAEPRAAAWFAMMPAVCEGQVCYQRPRSKQSHNAANPLKLPHAIAPCGTTPRRLVPLPLAPSASLGISRRTASPPPPNVAEQGGREEERARVRASARARRSRAAIGRRDRALKAARLARAAPPGPAALTAAAPAFDRAELVRLYP